MQKPWQIIIAVVVLVAAGFLFVRYSRPPAPLPVPHFAELGTIAAEETAQLLGRKGRVAMVEFDASRLGVSRLTAQIAECRSQLIKAGVQVVATESFRVPLSDSTLTDRWSQWMKSHADVDAVLLFGPAYGLSVNHFVIPGQPVPKIVAVLTFDANPNALKKLLVDGIVALAITPRTSAAEPGPGSPASPAREAFDRHFVVVTPAAAESLVETFAPEPVE